MSLFVQYAKSQANGHHGAKEIKIMRKVFFFFTACKITGKRSLPRSSWQITTYQWTGVVHNWDECHETLGKSILKFSHLEHCYAINYSVVLGDYIG